MSKAKTILVTFTDGKSYGYVNVESSATIRSVLNDNNVDYSHGNVRFNGVHLRDTDLDRTFQSFGIKEFCRLQISGSVNHDGYCKKKFDMSDYDKSYVMHCKTKEEADAFVAYMREHGRCWDNGNPYTDSMYHTHGDDTTYQFNAGLYGSMRYALLTGRNVLEYSDFEWDQPVASKARVFRVYVDAGDCVFRADVLADSSEVAESYMRKCGTVVSVVDITDKSSISGD